MLYSKTNLEIISNIKTFNKKKVTDNRFECSDFKINIDFPEFTDNRIALFTEITELEK